MQPDKKILIIVATHGNEPLGVQVVEKLKAKELDKFFDCLIANPRALQQGKEFIDANLNRVYPGKKDSELYEEQKAFENLKIAKQYRYIIDIHEASQGRDDFIIIPREKLSDKFPLNLINLPKVLLWPDPKGPLSQVLKNAIELEFGAKNRDREKMTNKAVGIIENFIKSVNQQWPARESQKDIYYVYGKLINEDFSGQINQLKDFQETEINQEKFYPLLTEQYLKQGIVCYKMRRVEQ